MPADGELLRTHQLTKTFPGVVAVDKVDFDVRPGEIHALVGENGAGKSTLIKILGGVYTADSGRIVFDGREVSFTSTHQSQTSKISMIYQEFNLMPDLTVAENIYIGREPKTAGLLINWRRINAQAQALLDRLDVRIDPRSYVADLPVAERQMVEIAKALSYEAKLIIMDEPTAALAVREVAKVLDLIRRLKEHDVSVILISHRMQDIFEVSDRIMVLRQGQKVGDLVRSQTTMDEVVALITGAQGEALQAVTEVA